jgi:uncharacterized OsmC-like protein
MECASMSQSSVKAALQKTMDNLKAKPGAAKVVFRAHTELDSGVRCRAKVRDFPPLTVDEPPELGGGNAGMNPVELVLASLGTCQEIMYAAYAAVMGITLTSVKVDVKGYLDLRGLFGMDASIPAGFQKIQFDTVLESPADPETLKKLAELVESHCPVLDTLTRNVEVSGKVTINGAQPYITSRAA